MPLIDGIGDEVVQFVTVVVLTVVSALAWRSTNAQPERYRTVFVMRPSRTSRPSLTISIPRQRYDAVFARRNESTPNSSPETNEITSQNDSDSTENARVIPVQEMDSIIDADMAMMDDDRLHFYRRIDTDPADGVETEPETVEEQRDEEEPPSSAAQIQEMDSIVSAMEADIEPQSVGEKSTENKESDSNTTEVDTNTNNGANTEANTSSPEIMESDVAAANNSPSESNDDADKILIKLKYLNDTSKEVEGNLNELLKDFKWRHFSSELTAAMRVRLIYNGHVLTDEAATLRALGLRDRAVVHCLVHPPAARRASPHQPQQNELDPNTVLPLTTDLGPQERIWDLENVLMTLVSVALTVVWFFRCEYSNMFTASASVALFGLTVFYSVAIFGLYLSDTFQLSRGGPAPAR